MVDGRENYKFDLGVKGLNAKHSKVSQQPSSVGEVSERDL